MAPVLLPSLQDRVLRVIVSRRRGMALSLVANAVLLALLVFKTAPQPALRRCSDFAGGACCNPITIVLT